MAGNRLRAIVGLAALGLLATGARAQEADPRPAATGPAAVELREAADAGRATRVVVTLKAEGQRPDFAEGGRRKPLPFSVETRLEFLERPAAPGEPDRPRRAFRRVERADVTIGGFRGEGQQLAVGLRPELALLLAERRPSGVAVVSAGGPMLRSELDMVQGPADPLVLADLLPVGPVEVGASWDAPADAAKALTEYDALAVNNLKATLASADEGRARIDLRGEVRGAVRGGEGTMRLDGYLIFDRKANLISLLRIGRAEVRKKGHVESAIEARSVLGVERTPLEAPPFELGDEALAGLPSEPDPALELLELVPPGGKYRLLHDRDWHLALDDVTRVVLKRIVGGDQVAQCDLIVGPNAGKGRHQDLDQLRADIRKALGENFVGFAGAGEVGGSPGGGFRYKLAVDGKPQEGGRPLWYYFLVAGPEGDQVLAVFSLTRELEERFGDQDLRLIGSLEWSGPAPAP